VADYVREHEGDTTLFDSVPLDEPDPLENQITHALDVTSYSDLKERAMRCHQTQFDRESFFFRVPPELRIAAWGEEHFIQVDPSLEPADPPASDLFAGIGD
jgi:LmbE family N-acetylglucosaminyl deacetylase